MMSNPKISIIIPVYNAERNLRQCLDSIHTQTYIDWECILIDDGSTDKSGAICDDYSAKDKRFNVFHKKNGGVSSARNLGLDNANGKYICFIDSDDYISPTYLVDFGEDLTSDIYVQGATFVQGETISPYTFSNDIAEETQSISAIVTRTIPYSPQGFSFRAPWAKLYKREVIGESRFDTSVSFAEDYLFNLAIYKKIHSLTTCNGCGYHYIQDNSYLSRKKFDINIYLGWFDKIQESVYELSSEWNKKELYKTVTELRVNWLSGSLFYKEYSISDKVKIAKYLKDNILDKRNTGITYNNVVRALANIPINPLSLLILTTALSLKRKISK